MAHGCGGLGGVSACIVPPHMLRVIEMRGDARLKRMARVLLDQNERVRRVRAGRARALLPGATGLLCAPHAEERAEVRNLRRAIHDGRHRAALPGVLARAEGEAPTGDPAVDTAYDGAGAVYDLYFDAFGRDSLDGEGMPIVATVRHRRRYNNAFWTGTQMVFGDGDGRIFRTFLELSVIGHEMSHGVVQFSGGLVYDGQAGALNESLADVFGSLARQRTEGTEAHEADWLIGKGILGPDINGVALRSLRMPGTAYADGLIGEDPQPFHMDLYVDTTEDHGGVHINSGIPNHAFYLVCMYLGGRAWERPGQIWYHALQRLNDPYAGFHDWARATVQAAAELHGLGSGAVRAVQRAWRLVGLPV